MLYINSIKDFFIINRFDLLFVNTHYKTSIPNKKRLNTIFLKIYKKSIDLFLYIFKYILIYTVFIMYLILMSNYT